MRTVPMLILALSGLAAIAPAGAAQTRAYVVSWFGQATNSDDKDCSGGVHPEVEQLYLRYAALLGTSKEQIAIWRKQILDGEDYRELFDLISTRGRIDGKPVNPYTHPASVMDIKLPGLDGRLGYGFDLDGKGPDQPGAFEDPETHQHGIDHQLYRALGCARAFRGSLAGRPTYWAWAWGQLKESQPAWLIRVSGADLTKDGPVTVTLDRAIEHLRSNSDGTPRRDTAYRSDSDPRSHNVFRGEIKDGLVTLTEHGPLRLLQNPLGAPELDLKSFHLRLKLKSDGTAQGFMGGYQPWHPIYWGFAGVGNGGEQQVTGDIPALYYLMKRYADADPDPRTGQNMRISVTYYIEAVPAFVRELNAPADRQMASR